MIKITKELIERYHLNECTAAERTSVEQWLEDDFFDEEIIDQETAIPQKLESDLWTEISKVMPDHIPETASKNRKPLFQLTAAALLLLTGTLYFLFVPTPDQAGKSMVRNSIIINNNTMDIKHVDDAGYSISISPGTSANINYKNGIIAFTGSIIISAKKDIELNIKGINEKLQFKAGQTYIGLMGKFPNNRTIIVSTQNLMDLPPLLQKQVINEFRI